MVLVPKVTEMAFPKSFRDFDRVADPDAFVSEVAGVERIPIAASFSTEKAAADTANSLGDETLMPLHRPFNILPVADA